MTILFLVGISLVASILLAPSLSYAKTHDITVNQKCVDNHGDCLRSVANCQSGNCTTNPTSSKVTTLGNATDYKHNDQDCVIPGTTPGLAGHYNTTCGELNMTQLNQTINNLQTELAGPLPGDVP